MDIISGGLGSMSYFGLNTVQSEDTSLSNDGDNKLISTTKLPILCERKNDREQIKNKDEHASFAFNNSSL